MFHRLVRHPYIPPRFLTIKQLAIGGPLKLPPLDVDATVAGDGTLQSVKLAGADKLVATLSPKGADIGFEISAPS